MKITVTLSIDHEIKAKAMNIIQNEMGSTLSREVEGFLSQLIDRVGDKQDGQ